MSLFRMIKDAFSAGMIAGETKARDAIQQHVGLLPSVVRTERAEGAVIEGECVEVERTVDDQTRRD